MTTINFFFSKIQLPNPFFLCLKIEEPDHTLNTSNQFSFEEERVV